MEDKIELQYLQKNKILTQIEIDSCLLLFLFNLQPTCCRPRESIGDYEADNIYVPSKNTAFYSAGTHAGVFSA